MTANKSRHLPAAEPVEIIEDEPAAEMEPAADIYRMDYAEIAARLAVESCQPAGTRPVGRAFNALLISCTQLQLTLELDMQGDALHMHLINCHSHNLITGKELLALQNIAAKTERPRDILAQIRVGLLRGWELIDAVKAGGF
ncbi:hypothetical protein [Atlantibacter hermannii]|uniref:hypothetical protein n=1 Tax=Atlantibacter hermannii TaxID=565 RepID=UPI0028AE1986|nr:hypothetical protein [Atlantibacter hermannii]